MRVLVTGGAGFIGSHVIDALQREGADVICVDSLDPGVYRQIPDYLAGGVDYRFVDLRTWRPDASDLEDVEAVFHLAALGGVGRAAREPGNIIEANVVGTARLLAWVRRQPRIRRVILAGSFSVYGSSYRYRVAGSERVLTGERREEDLEAGRYEVYCPDTGRAAQICPITEAASPHPLETYGASKYMQELCFAGFTHCPFNILRFSSVYGPRMRRHDREATIIARLAGWISSGKRPRLYEDGRQIRDWVFVMDVADAMIALVNDRPAPEVLNVCSGTPVRLVEACDYLAVALGVDCPPEIVGGYRPGDMRHCLGDAGRFIELLGREPRTLQETAASLFEAS